uniref:UBX domain-containing protein n=1 Tax=Romanomermis culicivorax TaxID=13658 RepID=A0A915HKD7_ROMCU
MSDASTLLSNFSDAIDPITLDNSKWSIFDSTPSRVIAVPLLQTIKANKNSIMDKIKAFFQQKKADVKFKSLGQGYKLSEGSVISSHSDVPVYPAKNLEDQEKKLCLPEKEKSTSSTSKSKYVTADAEQAAQAALRRMQISQQPVTSRSHQAIKAEAQKRIKAEHKEHDITAYEPEKKDAEAPTLLNQIGIYFTCDLLGDDVHLSKKDMQQAVETFLRENLETQDAIVASSIMIHSLNGYDVEKRQNGIEILSKYLQNIIQSPDEEKFRRIKTSNRVFVEKVSKLKGGVEFLKSVGFEEVIEENELYLIMQKPEGDTDQMVERLNVAYDCLLNGKPVPLKLYRNSVIFPPGQDKSIQLCSFFENCFAGKAAKSVDPTTLPDDFFHLSVQEIGKEQANKTREMENSLSLRTKEMRERDRMKQIYKYEYCLIRIRFPDEYVLQGTFKSAEPLQVLIEFIRKHIVLDWAPFRLLDITGQVLPQDDQKLEKTLAELDLSPSAILSFALEPSFVHDYISGGQSLPTKYLKSRKKPGNKASKCKDLQGNSYAGV